MSWTISFLGQETPSFFNIWELVAFGTAEGPRLWLLRIYFHKESTPIDPDLIIVQLIYCPSLTATFLPEAGRDAVARPC